MLQNFTTTVRELHALSVMGSILIGPNLLYARAGTPRASPKRLPKRHPVTARATRGFPATVSPPRLALRDEAQVVTAAHLRAAPQSRARQHRRGPRLSFPVSLPVGLSLRLNSLVTPRRAIDDGSLRNP